MSGGAALELAVAQRKEQATVGSLLGRRYAELLHAEKHTDCVFHVCEQQLKGHKLILSAASPVFEAMFYGPLQELEPEIEIHDISAPIFKVLLEYIYTGSVDYECMQLEAAIELYYAAEKYLLDQLIADALLAITRKLRFSNVLPALELSVCMGLDSLLDVCMSFFMRCCVNNDQYMSYLKEHYVHVSKECVKSIIAACKEPHKLLLWYVYEWTQQECDDAELGDAANWQQVSGSADLADSAAPTPPATLVERCYYKACRPFTVDAESHVWRLGLKSSRFISVLGLVLNSRLAPNLTCHVGYVPQEYRESLRIDLYPDGGDQPVWTHIIQNQTTKYNCDLHLSWSRDEACVLTPEVHYVLQLRWESSAYGAEYPCSLQSCLVDGIHFIDGDSFSGCLLKGLRYVNLV
ncbi:PREDICTED: BTB/POZ domain-containing protein 6-A [Drosophila arizonae]|uniref:BTB/POZ domain-containing protein 6-A n=1 Tax=Drosophila arizonae TaxID=7263 RepID=A0ABM1PIR8_DROAR|nr:PREDICTED: BTB/POZ domain-containing protein 6-A [Drosophila arizonae]